MQIIGIKSYITNNTANVIITGYIKIAGTDDQITKIKIFSDFEFTYKSANIITITGNADVRRCSEIACVGKEIIRD